MKFLFIFLAALFAQTTQASTDCISKEEMQEITQHFSQFRDLANQDYCYDGSETSHLLAGLMFMRKTQFANPMDPSKDQFFSGRFANAWYNYFIGRIEDFEVDRNCPKGALAYVYAFGGRTMYACTAMLTDNYTALDRASVFMHEARHIDGFPHITCSQGARAGLRGACDRQISDGGSYAVTVETYAQLARYATDIHPALKAYARTSAAVYADETFENPATIHRTKQFLVLTSDKRFHTVKTDGSTQALGNAPALGKIVMRGLHMILFPEDKTLPARFVFAKNEGEIPQQAGNQAIEYNGLTPDQRAQWVDVHIAAQWNAIVTKDKVRLTCDPRSNTATEIPFTGDAPVSLLYVNGYDRAAPLVQLMMDSGKLLELGCPNQKATLRPSALALDQKYKSVHKVGDLTLGLTLDGNVREIQSTGTSRPYSLGALDGKITALVPNQSLEFFQEN